MNPNITVFNENLLAVNFSYVGMGYIQNLSFDNYDDAVKNGLVITDSGKFIVNTADDVVMKYILPVMKVVMGFPTHLLHSDKGFCIYIKAERPTFSRMKNSDLINLLKKNDCYTVKRNLFNKICNFEKARRTQISEKGR